MTMTQRKTPKPKPAEKATPVNELNAGIKTSKYNSVTALYKPTKIPAAEPEKTRRKKNDRTTKEVKEVVDTGDSGKVDL